MYSTGTSVYYDSTSSFLTWRIITAVNRIINLKIWIKKKGMNPVPPLLKPEDEFSGDEFSGDEFSGDEFSGNRVRHIHMYACVRLLKGFQIMNKRANEPKFLCNVVHEVYLFLYIYIFFFFFFAANELVYGLKYVIMSRSCASKFKKRPWKCNTTGIFVLRELGLLNLGMLNMLPNYICIAVSLYIHTRSIKLYTICLRLYAFGTYRGKHGGRRVTLEICPKNIDTSICLFL